MKDVRFVVERTSNPRREPRSLALPELAITQHEINFFRRMPVIRIANVWREQRQTHPNVSSLFKAARTNDHRVRMTIGIGRTGVRRIAGSSFP